MPPLPQWAADMLQSAADPIRHAWAALADTYSEIQSALTPDLLGPLLVGLVLVFLFYPRLLGQGHRPFKERLVRSAVLCGLIALASIAWPVSAWLFGAYALHRALASAGRRLSAAVAPGLATRVAAHVAPAMAQSVAYVGYGMFLVALVQVLLWAGVVGAVAYFLGWLGLPDIDPLQVHLALPAALRRAEELLSVAYHWLLGVLSLEVLAVALAVLMAVVLMAPQSRAVTRFLSLRKAVSNAALVLLGVTSFTFFGALGMQRLDPEWRAIERIRAQAALSRIAADTREMAAAAWVEAEVRRLDDTARSAFAGFFSRAQGTLLAAEVARAAGVELAGKAPRLSASSGQADVPLDGVIPERVQGYFEGRAGSGPEPPLAELRTANVRLEEHGLKVGAARAAAIELASEALASLMPGTHRPLIDAFVQGLSGSLARGALNEVMPGRVTDVATARAWVRTTVHATAPGAKVHVPHAWQFDIAGLERGIAPGLRNAELLIAALVARLHLQQTLQMQARTARLAAESVGRTTTRAGRPRLFFRW
jgi:hypothetical protein